MKRLFIFGILLFGSLLCAHAEEINIVYTGETRGALYPCHCPIQPDGGVARRLTKLKELRSTQPLLILVDTGNLFAGGQMDSSSQNMDLDKKRTMANLAAVKLMRYDAVLIGYDEFNFGEDFLKGQISGSSIPFISGNVKSDKILPYLIKDVGDVRVAILGLTTLQAKDRAPGLEFIEPQEALGKAIEEVKEKSADVVVLLANFLVGEELDLIKNNPEIDILISPAGGESAVTQKIGSTIILHPAREGRRLGEIKLNIKDKKIVDYKTDEIRLSDKVNDDPEILKILPRCFTNRDCPQKEGFLGLCKEAGDINSQCVLAEAPRVALTIIGLKSCAVCNTDGQLDLLKSIFRNINVSYIDYETQKGKDLVKKAGVDALPVFLFDRSIEQDKGFSAIRDKLEKRSGYFLVKPEFIGMSYFLNRDRIKGSFDLFISIFEKNSAELIDMARPYKPKVHFLVVEEPGDRILQCPYGKAELEEDLRAVCVMKHYPEKFLDYISCRAREIDSSWWDNCAENLDIEKIRSCAKADTGVELLRENIKLNKELSISAGPTYLLSNQEIFSSRINPKPDELKKIFAAQK